MARAAGLIVVAPDGSLLLLRRTGGDFAGHWSLPAGHIEDGETALAAAIRETAEETGATDLDFEVDRSLVVLVDDDFAAFCAEASDAFEPVLNEEHDAHQWADLADLPSPLHPTIEPMLNELKQFAAAASPTGDAFHAVLVRGVRDDEVCAVKDTLPAVHFGGANAAPSDWRNEPDAPDADDDVIETPPDVAAMLGFDPVELEGVDASADAPKVKAGREVHVHLHGRK